MELVLLQSPYNCLKLPIRRTSSLPTCRMPANLNQLSCLITLGPWNLVRTLMRTSHIQHTWNHCLSSDLKFSGSVWEELPPHLPYFSFPASLRCTDFPCSGQYPYCPWTPLRGNNTIYLLLFHHIVTNLSLSHPQLIVATNPGPPQNLSHIRHLHCFLLSILLCSSKSDSSMSINGCKLLQCSTLTGPCSFSSHPINIFAIIHHLDNYPYLLTVLGLDLHSSYIMIL